PERRDRLDPLARGEPGRRRRVRVQTHVHGLQARRARSRRALPRAGDRVERVTMPDATAAPAFGFALPDEIADIRAAVRQLCDKFPGSYCLGLEPDRYPEEFVAALTEHGWLAALIPEQYGGAGLGLLAASTILEEISASGGNPGACHAQMYIMGTLLRHGSDEQKARSLPGIASGELRLQAFGVTEPTSGTDTSSVKTFARREGDHYVVNGQKIWTSRAEHSDLMILLARTTPKEKAKKRTDGLSVFIVDMREARGKGLEIRPIRTMMNHATTEVFFT